MAKKRRARPSKGRRLTKNRKIELARQACELYATDQYTLSECLAQVGINSDSTWYKWIAEVEEIEELYEEAKTAKAEEYRKGLVDRARTTLERYLEGFTIEVQEKEGTVSPDGTEVRINKIKTKVIYVKPSMRAVEFVLTNMDGRNFSRYPEPYKAGNEKLPTKLTIEIEGKEVPPITSEDDIDDIDFEPVQ